MEEDSGVHSRKFRADGQLMKHSEELSGLEGYIQIKVHGNSWKRQWAVIKDDMLICFEMKQDAIKQGWLRKKTENTFTWSNKKYYFTLRENALYYFSESNLKPKGMIRLSDIIDIKKVAGSDFIIVTPEETHFLTAEDPQDKDEWCRLLLRVKSLPMTKVKSIPTDEMNYREASLFYELELIDSVYVPPQQAENNTCTFTVNGMYKLHVRAESTLEMHMWIAALSPNTFSLQNDSNTICKGWLIKEPHMRHARHCRKRFAMIDGTKLLFFKSENLSQPSVGILYLNSLCSVNVSEAQKRFTFILNACNNTTVSLTTATAEEAERWIAKIRSVIDSCPAVKTITETAILEMIKERKIIMYGTFYQEAVKIFNTFLIQNSMTDLLKLVHNVLQTCFDIEDLQSEIFCQLIKQTAGLSPNDMDNLDILSYWQTLACMCYCFVPERVVCCYLEIHIKMTMEKYPGSEMAKVAERCSTVLHQTKKRKYPPSKCAKLQKRKLWMEEEVQYMLKIKLEHESEMRDPSISETWKKILQMLIQKEEEWIYFYKKEISDIGTRIARQKEATEPEDDQIFYEDEKYPGVMFTKGHKFSEQITSARKEIHLEDDIGISIVTPENTVLPDESVDLVIQPCLAFSGPFEMPGDIESASPVYLIKTNKKVEFKKPLLLKIQHYADLQTAEDCKDMVFLRANSDPVCRGSGQPVYIFRKVEGDMGKFSKDGSQIGEIALTHFSWWGIGKRKSNAMHQALYSARLYKSLSPTKVTAVFCMCPSQNCYTKVCNRRIAKDHGMTERHGDRTTYTALTIISDSVSLFRRATSNCRVLMDRSEISRHEIELVERSSSDYPIRIVITITPTGVTSEPVMLSVHGLDKICTFEIPAPNGLHLTPQVNTRLLQEARNSLEEHCRSVRIRNSPTLISARKMVDHVKEVEHLVHDPDSVRLIVGELQDIQELTSEMVARVEESHDSDIRRRIVPSILNFSRQLRVVVMVKLNSCAGNSSDWPGAVDTLVNNVSKLMNSINDLLRAAVTDQLRSRSISFGNDELTSTASDYSSFQASLPPSRHPYLERQLDFDQGGVDRDLNKIADSIINWEMNLSVELGLTNNEIHDIKAEHPINNALQRRAVLRKWKEKQGLRATYGNLLRVCCGGRDASTASVICEVLRRRVLQESLPQESPMRTAPQEPPIHAASQESLMCTAPQELPMHTAPQESLMCTAPQEPPMHTASQESLMRTAPQESPMHTAPRESPMLTASQESLMHATHQGSPMHTALPELPTHTVSQESPTRTASQELHAALLETKPHPLALCKELDCVDEEWRTIGLYLSLEEEELNELESSSPMQCLKSMVTKWLSREQPPPTWSCIIEVLELMEHKQLSLRVKQRALQCNRGTCT